MVDRAARRELEDHVDQRVGLAGGARGVQLAVAAELRDRRPRRECLCRLQRRLALGARDGNRADHVVGQEAHLLGRLQAELAELLEQERARGMLHRERVERLLGDERCPAPEGEHDGGPVAVAGELAVLAHREISERVAEQLRVAGRRLLERLRLREVSHHVLGEPRRALAGGALGLGDGLREVEALAGRVLEAAVELRDQVRRPAERLEGRLRGEQGVVLHALDDSL